ncbi:hypothetical protein CMEL01_14254 [Colletotrichum melonis]|uniref:Uncharacterized protein n=1 Tax=Colletotrichum melonis TaxID=1209925 RepID=A0AAI9USX3_9PEZI|nr:hypothetical protein CMEL01_14254 [Colletotrichum melonis]
MHPTAPLITNVAREKSIQVVHNTTNSSSQGRVPATSATQYASAIKRVGHPRREPGPDRITRHHQPQPGSWDSRRLPSTIAHFQPRIPRGGPLSTAAASPILPGHHIEI